MFTRFYNTNNHRELFFVVCPGHWYATDGWWALHVDEGSMGDVVLSFLDQM